MMPRILLALLALVSLSACAVPIPKNYEAFSAADPHSILVVPPVNRSVDALAPDYLLTTIARPLGNRGYYVFPVNLVKRVLEDDGLSDADMVHAAEPTHIGQLFGADTILYITIDEWTAQYMVINTTVKVNIAYVLKETLTGQTIWEHRQLSVFNSNQGGGGGLIGLVAQAISAAITKAAPNYIAMARQANRAAFGTPQQGIPPGPHFREDPNQPQP